MTSETRVLGWMALTSRDSVRARDDEGSREETARVMRVMRRSELQPRRELGVGLAHTVVHVLFRELIDVEAKLALELVLDGFVAEERPADGSLRSRRRCMPASGLGIRRSRRRRATRRS
jgi:hypothetical protein